jgi:hypothetical protein
VRERLLGLPVAVVVAVMWLVGAVLNRYERSGSVPRGAGLGSDAGGGIGVAFWVHVVGGAMEGA